MDAIGDAEGGGADADVVVGLTGLLMINVGFRREGLLAHAFSNTSCPSGRGGVSQCLKR